MRFLMLALFVLAACAPRVIQAPAAASPTPAAQPTAKNQAVTFALSWLPLIDPEIKCEARTGRETQIPSKVDTCVCTSQASKVKLGCEAPDEGSPTCRTIADWNPPRPPAAPEPAPAPTPAPAAGKSTKPPAK